MVNVWICYPSAVRNPSHKSLWLLVLHCFDLMMLTVAPAEPTSRQHLTNRGLPIRTAPLVSPLVLLANWHFVMLRRESWSMFLKKMACCSTLVEMRCLEFISELNREIGCQLQGWWISWMNCDSLWLWSFLSKLGSSGISFGSMESMPCQTKTEMEKVASPSFFGACANCVLKKLDLRECWPMSREVVTACMTKARARAKAKEKVMDVVAITSGVPVAMVRIAAFYTANWGDWGGKPLGSWVLARSQSLIVKYQWQLLRFSLNGQSAQKRNMCGPCPNRTRNSGTALTVLAHVCSFVSELFQHFWTS